MQSTKMARLTKTYESPTLKKLEPEEAKSFLLHHATMGDPGAKEILTLVLAADQNSCG